jgi:nickel-dependent lactate racemase
MRIAVDCGRQRIELEVAESRLLAPPAAVPALADPAAALKAALESPIDFPPLRQALTPDDHVVVVVDERLAALGRLLPPLLESLEAAGVGPAAVTLLCPPSTAGQPWLEELPDAFEDVRLEVHDPAERKKLAYLATTRGGRRLYLNRTLVDADQVVVLSARRYTATGSAGAEAALFPALSDAATRAELADRPAAAEMTEAQWLLGQPFLIEVIEGAGDGVAAIVAGAAGVGDESRRRLARWRVAVPRPADLVVAALGGDPARHTFADLSAAAACAASVVRPDGRIVLLTQAAPQPGPGGDVLLGAEEPQEAVERLQRQARPEQAAALAWARAACQAHLCLVSGLADDTAEDLFATPLSGAGPVQRLLDAAGSCLLLPDAHRARAVIEE